MSGVWILCRNVDLSSTLVWHLFDAEKTVDPLCETKVLDEKFGGPTESVGLGRGSGDGSGYCADCLEREKKKKEEHKKQIELEADIHGARRKPLRGPDDYNVRAIAATKALLCIQKAEVSLRSYIMLRGWADVGQSEDAADGFFGAHVLIASAQQWMSGSLDKRIREDWERAANKKNTEYALATPSTEASSAAESDTKTEEEDSGE